MICVIIPTYNAAEQMSGILAQLKTVKLHAPQVRIVVSDGMSDDETIKIAISNNAQIAVGSKGRGDQLCRGTQLAQDAAWFLFLHADSDLAKGWFECVCEHITHSPDTAAYFTFKFSSAPWQGRLMEGLVRLRNDMFGLPYGDQGLLISRDLYVETGGYSALSAFEDVDIVRRIGRARLTRLHLPIATSAEKYWRDGFFKRGWRNFRLLRRYLAGENVDRLAQDYELCVQD